MKRAVIAVAFSLICVPLLAQSIGGGPGKPVGPSENWGGAALSRVSIGPFAFAGVDSTTTYAYDVSGPVSIYRTAGAFWFMAPLQLPTGARVEEVTVEFCDTSATGRVIAWFTTNSLANGIVENQLFDSGFPETPGCVAVTTPVNFVIDNTANAYLAEVRLEEPNSTQRLIRYTVGYRLLVSPGPGVATFTDVPTGHGFFKFVEALYAAGITGGCGGSNFCPDAPLTRGQMAVFLSTALGLHWPN